MKRTYQEQNDRMSWIMLAGILAPLAVIIMMGIGYLFILLLDQIPHWVEDVKENEESILEEY